MQLNKTVKPNSNLFKKIFNTENQNNNSTQRVYTNTSKNKKRNNRKSIKYYSINIRNKINNKMNVINKKSRYKRNIYKLLYDQIHSDIAEIENEIEIGKKLVVPYHVLKNNMIKNRKLFNKKSSKTNLKEEESGSKKAESTKYKIHKLKNINLINNSYLSNTTISSTTRNDFKMNTLSSFTKFKKNNIFIPNLKTRNKRNLTLIKAITENNNNYVKNSFLLTNNIDNNNEKIKKNVLQVNNNDNFLDKKYANTERNNINNIFLRLNSKSVDKTIMKTSLHRDIPETQMNKRKKCLYITYDEKWYLRNKFIYIKLDKLVVENNYIQSRIIHDQYALINESIKIFKSKYLVSKELTIKFNSTNFQNQQIININIEETIGLMIEISYILLEKYEDNLVHFITQVIKRPSKDEYKIVEDEKKEFGINITLFTEANSFLTVSYKSYLVLIQKDEYYKIKKYNFERIQQFFDRLRLGVNKIILDMKNLFIGNNIREKKIITECVQKIIKIKEQKEVYEKKQKLDCHKKFGAFYNGIDPFKYKGKLKMKPNEDKEIYMRINKALGKKNYNETNFNNIKKFDINSKLVSNLMKYGTKEFREFIIYERIRRQFYDKEKEKEKENNSSDNDEY